MKHDLWNGRSLWAMFRKARFLPHRRVTSELQHFFQANRSLKIVTRNQNPFLSKISTYRPQSSSVTSQGFEWKVWNIRAYCMDRTHTGKDSYVPGDFQESPLGLLASSPQRDTPSPQENVSVQRLEAHGLLSVFIITSRSESSILTWQERN